MKLKTLKLLILLPLLITCHSDQSTEPNFIEVGKGFFTVLPLDPDDFNLLVNLGHLSHPGHTFPSAHGGFVLTDYMERVPVLSPADMDITQVTEGGATDVDYVEYTLRLSVNDREFSIMLGHMSALHPDILEAVRAVQQEKDCETYTTGGHTFSLCSTHTRIPVSAGDTLGMAGGNPGQLGLDFGVYDLTADYPWATTRFSNTLYKYAVSPLDYFTDEITSILIPRTGDFFCNGIPTVRTKPPIGGTHCYDVPGTAQGIWFLRDAPDNPEDPHIAFIYHNVDPDVPIVSMGTSVPGLTTGPYSYTPVDTGTVNPIFTHVKPDGHDYRFHVKYLCSGGDNRDAVLLVRMMDDKTLMLEKQSPDNGPPWEFTGNEVIFER